MKAYLPFLALVLAACSPTPEAPPRAIDVDEVQFSDDLINWKTEVYIPNRTGSKTRFVRIKPKVVTDKK